MDSILLHLCSGSLLILVKIANPEYLKIYKPKFCHKILVLWQKSAVTFPAHRGTALSKLIDSCIACVNECDMSPNISVDPINNKYKDN